MEGFFTPKAQKTWDSIAKETQDRILSSVWCALCDDSAPMGNFSGDIEAGLLVMRGQCSMCGNDVTRIIGTKKMRSLFYKMLAKRKMNDILKESRILKISQKRGNGMKRTLLSIGLALGLAAVIGTAGVVSFAASLPPVYSDPDGVAIDGYDTVAYFTTGKPVWGEEKYAYKWNGARWFFSSNEHLELFKAAPEKYAPQYGGY